MPTEPDDPLLGEFEQIQVLRDPEASVLAIMVIDDTRAGPAFGGIRRYPYPSTDAALRDAQRLAKAMTLKCAIAQISGGGGKTVILDRPGMDRERAYALVGQHVEAMGGRYYTGPDVGTEAGDLEVIAQQTRFVARPGPEGPGDLAVPTALGVFSAMEAVAARLSLALSESHVVIQGLGAVGWRLAEALVGVGAKITVADVRQIVTERAREELGARVCVSEDVVRTQADIFAPCALGGVIDPKVAQQIPVRAVVGSANNVLSSWESGEALWRRNVLYAPDFVANCGALIHGALFHLQGGRPDSTEVTRIGALITDIFDESRDRNRPPERVAKRLAKDRLAQNERRPFFPHRSLPAE